MKILKLILPLGVIFSLFACAHLPEKKPEPTPQTSQKVPPSPPKKKANIEEISETEPPKEARSPAEKPFLTLQSSSPAPSLLKPPPSKMKSSGPKYELTLDLEGADLLEFLELIFVDTLKRNYVVDPSVRAKVTVHLKGKFTEKELIDLLNQVLELQNVAILKKGNIYYVTSIAKLGKISTSYSFAIYRPRYISAANLQSVAKAFVSQQALVLVHKQTDTIIIVDLPDNLNKVLKIINLLDQNLLQNFYLEVYRPQVLEAEKLAGYLQKIFRSQVFRYNTPQNYVDFLALKELNSLLIMAKNKEALESVKRWLSQLDSGETLERQVFVYYVENGDAEEIAKILQDAFSEVTESQRKTIIKAKKQPTKSKGLSGKVKIIPDKTNNLLLIAATPEDYRIILNLLKNIDIIPRQVLIEVIIAEISLNKNLEYGVEWWIRSNFKIDGRRYEGKIVSVNNYLGVPGKGFSFTVYRGLDPRALLAALDEISEVHILSNPVILATDNKEAQIQIGEEVPTVAQRVVNTAADNPNITQSIQYRDVGIILKVKPHINSSGLVKLDVVQEISSVSDKVVQGVSSPVFTKRKIETSLVVQDGHTVILGGLIQNQHNTNEAGVPILKDIPYAGSLFRWRGTKKDRKELLVAITPRVVRNTAEAEQVMREWRERIQELQEKLSKEFEELRRRFENN